MVGIMSFTKVILKEKLSGVGVEADVVKVKAGYARNYLIPKGIAYEATQSNIKHIEGLKKARAKREAEELEGFNKVAKKLDGTNLRLDLEVGESGKAFGAITNIDIHKALENKGYKFDRHCINLDKPIKGTSDTEVEIRLHPQVAVTITVKVNAIVK